MEGGREGGGEGGKDFDMNYFCSTVLKKRQRASSSVDCSSEIEKTTSRLVGVIRLHVSHC